MKGQGFFILGLIFALIIAVLAVINNDPVQFNYVFGSQKWPLILIILTTAVFGGVVCCFIELCKNCSIKRTSETEKQANR